MGQTNRRATWSRAAAAFAAGCLSLIGAVAVLGVSGAAHAADGVRSPAAVGARPVVAAASFITLQNLSGLCAQTSAANPTSTNVQLVVATCDPYNPGQHWATVFTGTGQYKLVNQATGGCMNARGSLVSGAPIDTAFCSTGNSVRQVWAENPPSPTFPAYAQVKIAASPGLCLAPDGPYGQAGVGLVVRPCAGLDFRQYWFGG